MTTKENIYTKMSTWADEGIIIPKARLVKELKGMTKTPYAEVNRLISMGDVFRTSVEGILFTSKDERDEFECWYNMGAIATLDRLAILRKEDNMTLYLANKLSQSGEILRFDKLGVAGVLYISDMEEN